MNDHYSAAILESALTGQLPLAEEQRLHQHLEQCPQCSEALEQMAGGPTWCREAAALLTEDALDADVPTHEHWSEIDFTVEHLEPADEPNVLGRLGGYDVLEVIGRGGMGVVLKALDRDLKRLVAIKVLAPHLAQSPLAKKRFAREAQAAAAVVHSNVLAIHQVQPLGRLPFLVMPLVAGESLAERLAAQGTLELKEILRISMQAAAGLAAAHEQGLVHRDVKPANILLEHGIERAVLTDFGLARAADDVTLTRWGIVAGTPQYMSPEQARGEPLDGRSDLFSLGCVLYEMATGISPFRADSMLATMRRLVDETPQSMATFNPELPPWFIAIVEKLLEKDPARRFSSAAEVSQLLEGCLAHLQQPTNVPLPEGLPSDTVTKRTNRGSFFGRRPFRWIGGIVALLLFTIGAVGAFLFATGDPPDIAGEWTGKDWGSVVLKQSDGGAITGTYSDVFDTEPGKIELKWSRIERRFNGTWNEGKDRYGKLSIRLLDDEIRGGWTTNRKAKINGGTPDLADLLWVRPKSNAAAKDDAGKSRASDKETTSVNWTFGPVKNLMMFTTSSNLSSDALRLSDGHLFNLPKKGADKKGNDGEPIREELEKWFAETSVNFTIDYRKQTNQWELKLRNVRFAQLPDDDWKTLDAKELQSRFPTVKWNTPENREAEQKETGFYSLKFSRGITPPMTFAFETDDGVRGVFQFVATNITSTGVNAIMRLKLLRPMVASRGQVEGDETASNSPNDPAQAGWSFGTAKNAGLNRAGLGQGREVLRLRDGEIFSVPKTFSFEKSGNGSMTLEEQRKWLDEKNVNLAYDYDPQAREWEMKLRNLRYCEISHDDFRTLTARQFYDRLSEIDWKSTDDGDNSVKKGGFYSWKVLDPPAMAFQTAEGQYGILAITRSTETTTTAADGKPAKNRNMIGLQYRLLDEVRRPSAGHGDSDRNPPATSPTKSPTTKLTFGPVIEPALNDIAVDFKVGPPPMLNLETGEELTPPDGMHEFDQAKGWAQAHGADIIACRDGGGRGLRIIDGLAIQPASWDASAKEVVEAISNTESGLESYKNAIPGFQDPREPGFANLWVSDKDKTTFFIKTRGGSIGILQITEAIDGPTNFIPQPVTPHRILFRYKLLRPTTPKHEKLDGTGGIHTDLGKEKSIADTVLQFTTRAEWDPIGKDQPPLTEDELRGAIYSLAHTENDRFSTDEKQELKKAAAIGVLPKDWQLEVFTKIGGALGERFQGWMIYLSRQRPDSKQGFLVRQQLLSLLDEDGNPAPLPATRKSNQADDGATPLAAAINGFNAAHHTVRNVRQKPLTEEEVVAGIRWWKTRRNDAPVTNGEFAQFQKIADTRELPKGTEFEVIPDFIHGDGTEHFIWSVRIKMPREAKAGWTYAYEIRRQYVHSEGIDDVQRKAESIAWGPAATNGLQAGVRLEPHQENYSTGQQVTPIFYYRNAGKTALRTSFPRLMTHSYYKKVIAVDKDGKPIAIDQDPNPTGPVGWIEELLRPGAQHEIKGLPIMLGDIDRGAAGAVIRAEPGQSLRIHFELSDMAEEHAPPLSTGDASLAMAGTPAALELAEPAEAPTPSSKATPHATRRIETDLGVHHLACSSDGKRIAVANGNPTFVMHANGVGRPNDGWQPAVEILDAESGNVIARLELTTAEEDAVLAGTERVNHFEVTALAFSPDGNTLAVGTDIGQIKLYDAKDGKFLSSLDDSQGKAADARTPENWKTIPRALGNVASIAFSPDGNLLVACGQSFADVSDRFSGISRLGLKSTGPGRLKVWDLDTGTLKHDLAGHSHAQAVAFSSDGKLLASAGEWMTASNHGTGIIIWDPQTGKKTLTSSTDANCGAHSVCFSPTRKQIVWSAVRYDKENDKYATSVSLTYPLSGITDWQKTIPGWAFPKAFLPDGKRVAVQHGNAIEIVDTETGATKHELKPLGENAGEHWNDFAIAPAGTIFIGGNGADKMRGFLELWNLKDIVPGGNQTNK